MKSAYELAMERLNKDNPMEKLTDEQKAKIAEIDSKYAAKWAEKEIFLQGEISKAVSKGDLEAVESLNRQLGSDRRQLEQERDDKKARIREGKA